MSAHAIAVEPSPSFDLAGIPEPIKQCDGSWRVPMWTPERGWEETTWDPDVPGAVTALGSRARCPEPGACTALHEEDFTPAEVATVRAMIEARQ